MTELDGAGANQHQVNLLDQLLDRLNGDGDGGTPSSVQNLTEAAEELAVCREELRVMDDELRAQSAELARLREQLSDPGPWSLHVLEGLPVAVLLLDGDGTVVQANHRAAGCIGTAHALLVGKPFAVYVELQDRKRFRDVWADVVAGGDETSIDVTLRVNAGEQSRPAHLLLMAHHSTFDSLRVRCVIVPDVSASSTPLDAAIKVAAGLASFANLPFTSDDLASKLEDAAVATAQAIPGATCATLSMHGDDEVAASTGSSHLGQQIDQAQRELGQGPSLDTIRDRRPLSVSRLAEDPRWPGLAERAAALGLGSVMTAPVLDRRECLGVLAVWGPLDALPPAAEELLGLVAEACSAVVRTDRQLEDGHRRVTRLLGTLESRTAIERATGIMLARGQRTPDEALDELVRLSSQLGVPVKEAAQHVVETTSGPDDG